MAYSKNKPEDFRLGDWLVRPALGRLVGPKGDVPLEPRAMEVLLILAEHAEQVVSRQQIIDGVWRREYVGDGIVSGVVSKLRKALGDDATSPRYVETIPKRGYRLLVSPAGGPGVPHSVGEARQQSHPGAPAPLGSEPAAAVALAETGAALPPFLAELPEPEHSVFVAREPELARLNGALDQALAGRGRIAFVTGEAGTGKTALIREAALRATAEHGELVVASGICSAQSGIGDAFAPWRQLLALLTGDVETGLASGLTGAEPAVRLWEVTPIAAEAVTASGGDLVGTLIPAAALLARARAASPTGSGWLRSLEELIQRKASLPPDVALQQSAVFMQVARVLGSLARQRPLLLVLEDLHWADAGSIALLFHLGCEIGSHRMLVVGSYRPSDVAVGRGTDRHPLEAVVAELTGRRELLQVELGERGDRAFVEALVDSESNRLRARFRERLFRQTGGHALFTVEALRSLQDRGQLVRDRQGRWTEGDDLDWDTLPDRVEGVLGARLERLPEPLRELLAVASVEGEIFTAEVVAEVLGLKVRDVIRRLSRELGTRHRLVSARGVRAVNGGRLSSFSFAHSLFQRYLYGRLNEVERVQLHHDVANCLASLHVADTEEVAVRLAHHFEQAGVIDRAVHFLHQAGERATHMTANREAIGHYSKALELLATLPVSDERDRIELALQMAVQAPLIATLGFGSPRVGAAVKRAHHLVNGIADEDMMVPVLHQLGIFEGCARSLAGGIALGERVLELAGEREDDAGMILASLALGLWRASGGELERGRAHLETAVSLYDPQRHQALAQLSGMDPVVASLAHLSWLTSHMGYLDQGVRYLAEAIELGERLGHPYSLAAARYSVWPHLNRHDFGRASDQVEALRAMVASHGFVQMAGFIDTYTGMIRIAGGRLDDTALEHCSRGVSLQRATGMKTFLTANLWVMAWAHRAAGHTREALAALDEAEDLMSGYGERLMEPALKLCRAEIVLETDGESAAEALMLESLEIARRQGARLYELHTAKALACLWQRQGKRREARELLEPVYGWFTEGLDTPPLLETKALLDELSD